MLQEITPSHTTNLQTSQVSSSESVKPENDNNQALSRAEQRRLFYESIAYGNAVAEAEDNARRRWRGD